MKALTKSKFMALYYCFMAAVLFVLNAFTLQDPVVGTYAASVMLLAYFGLYKDHPISFKTESPAQFADRMMKKMEEKNGRTRTKGLPEAEQPLADQIKARMKKDMGMCGMDLKSCENLSRKPTKGVTAKKGGGAGQRGNRKPEGGG